MKNLGTEEFAPHCSYGLCGSELSQVKGLMVIRVEFILWQRKPNVYHIHISRKGERWLGYILVCFLGEAEEGATVCHKEDAN